jgi:hypothetical protein
MYGVMFLVSESLLELHEFKVWFSFIISMVW